MSLLAISLTIKQVIADPLAKFLLLLMADRHNGDTGDCFPSINRLCEDSGLSRSTVIRKIQVLEDLGLIRADERRRANGSKQSNAYRLLFVPDAAEGPVPKPKVRRSEPSTPPADWWPRDETIAKLRQRYPHHDTSDETVDYLVREWLDYCAANGRRYIEFDRAWSQSAERYLRRQSARPASLRRAQGQRGGAGALSAAIRRLGGGARG